MIRVIVAFLVLGLGAIGWVLLLPGAGPHKIASGTPVIADAATVKDATPAKAPAVVPAESGREIRVVYPGPDGTASVRKLVDKVVAEASPVPAAQASTQPAVPAPPPPAPVAASAPPLPQQTASAVPAAAAAPTAVPSTSGAAVNINTASVDALNQLPGVGHIGRTIASHRPYGSIEELVSKRVLRKSVYDRIKDQIAAN